MFEAFVKYTAVEDEGGYTSVGDVTEIPPPQRDNMESFWLVSTFYSILITFFFFHWRLETATFVQHSGGISIRDKILFLLFPFC